MLLLCRVATDVAEGKQASTAFRETQLSLQESTAGMAFISSAKVVQAARRTKERLGFPSFSRNSPFRFEQAKCFLLAAGFHGGTTSPTLFETPPTLFETPPTLFEILLTLFEILLTLFETPRTLVETPRTLVEICFAECGRRLGRVGNPYGLPPSPLALHHISPYSCRNFPRIPGEVALTEIVRKVGKGAIVAILVPCIRGKISCVGEGRAMQPGGKSRVGGSLLRTSILRPIGLLRGFAFAAFVTFS